MNINSYKIVNTGSAFVAIDAQGVQVYSAQRVGDVIQWAKEQQAKRLFV